MVMKPQELSELAETLYADQAMGTPNARTLAIGNVFKELLFSEQCKSNRPDELWTALMTAYYRKRANPEIERYVLGELSADELIGNLLSVRQGWVKSSGSAYENILEGLYQQKFDSISHKCKIKIAKKTNVRAINPINLNDNMLGTHEIDDLYLLVSPNGNSWTIFAMISAQASGGDRWTRAEQRCLQLRASGVNCINFTLDPRDVERSPNGMMMHPAYLKKFQSPNPSFNAHFIMDLADGLQQIPANLVDEHGLSLPSRIFRTDPRKNIDCFVATTIQMASKYLRHKQLSSTEHWSI